MTKPEQADSQQETTLPPPSQPAQPEQPSKTSKTPLILSLIAIVLAVVLTAGLYWHGHSFSQKLEGQVHIVQTALEAKAGNLEQELAARQRNIDALEQSLEAQQQSLDAVRTELELTKTQRESVQRQLSLLNVKDAKHWRLNEANYLIKLAAHKLWLEQDIATAIALLNEADQGVALAEDAQLLRLRRAISDDIRMLKAIPLVDRDGIALTLESLLGEVDKLQLSDIELPEAVAQEEQKLSPSTSEWQDNLVKSWNKFSENFITVRRRDGQVEALIEPKHAWFLKENLKMQLQQAEQALFRQQGDLFNTKLARAEQWVGEYFNQNAQARALIDELQQLQQLEILTQLPESLSSLNEAEKALKDRERRLIGGEQEG